MIKVFLGGDALHRMNGEAVVPSILSDQLVERRGRTRYYQLRTVPCM